VGPRATPDQIEPQPNLFNNPDRISGLGYGGAIDGSPQEKHDLSIIYDHRSRPLMVIDHNNTTGLEARTQYYWASRTASSTASTSRT
jgi:hypothetical protein